MLRRKRDFKPDRTGTSLLSKLYVTPRQRRLLLKWGVIALLTLALSLAQDVILCRVSILGASTDLVAAGILLLSVLLPTDDGAIFALVASTVYYFSGSSPGSYCILLLTALGIAANILRANLLRRGFASNLLCAAAAMLVYEMLVYVLVLFLGYTTLSRMYAFGITAALSCAAMVVLYPLFSAACRIGGDSWKD
ncbi:MAG: hypothetical protein LUH51_01205 [Firmicutes bacterium]|nr:hypothetical protein [Bacillota bacterium]